MASMNSEGSSVAIADRAPVGSAPVEAEPPLDAASPAAIVPVSGESDDDSGAGRFWAGLRRLLFGRPIPTALEHQERLTKVKALAVFSSDALASVAYATEEIMKVLVLGGAALLASFIMPISFLIAALLAIVVLSYRQIIKAYPSGGGSYI